MRPSNARNRLAALGLLAAALPVAPLAAPLAIDDAIRAAWDQNPGLAASASMAEAARADADRAQVAGLPTLSVTAKAVRTDEPMMAFGLKLDQGRIGMADFNPASLNAPEPRTGVGAGAAISMPLYVGGRIRAGQRAAGSMAGAAAADDARRRMEMAEGVVEAYFGAQAAAQGIRYAEDLLAHARETERFVRERNAQGLMLDADVARSAAFRAQAEAELAAAQRRSGSARSALALLTGAPADAELATPLDAPAGAAPAGAEAPPADRPDLLAAQLRRDAAEQGAVAARGSLMPAVFAQASAEAMRTADLAHGQHWTNLGLMLRWDLSLSDAVATRAAAARARAAAEDLDWRRRQADREVAEARAAVSTAEARIQAAAEAVTASESVRTLRDSRHRQGLLPLTDVLDADAALAGARALLLASRLEARIARAQLALALHNPIEGQLP